MALQTMPRPRYIARLNAWRGKNEIKVVMGPRRCGKSFLLKLFRKELLEVHGVPEDAVATFSLDRLELERLHDPSALHEAVLERCAPGRTTYVFIDEVQECKGFEKVLSSLQGREGIDLYVTGSNAYMLSGELATKLTGRYLPIKMLPLSFAEYRTAVADEGLSIEEDFDLYLKRGGFPAVVQDRRNALYTYAYFGMLENDLILKDVVPRYEVRDTQMLLKLARTLASGIGSATSAAKIANTLTSAGRAAAAKTINAYLKGLTDCYLFLEASRFDVRGREILRTQSKYYLSDPGFRGYYNDSAFPDLGRLLENVVFLELKRRFERVNVGKNAEHEVDFVVNVDDRYAYIQVAWTVADPETLARELRAFDNIRDSYPRYLLTMDVIGKNRSIKGVMQLNVIDWLLGKTELLDAASP